MKETVTTVARVNEVDIVIIEGEEKRVAVKPICQALGIAFQRQIERLKEDPILGSVVTLEVTTGADGKQYEMVTIPFKFVFGWLFRIDSRNVKEESRESVLKYQLHCYNALYNSLFLYVEFVEHRANLVEIELENYKEAREGFSQARSRMTEAESNLNRVRQLTYEKYVADKNQLELEFNEGKDAGNE